MFLGVLLLSLFLAPARGMAEPVRELSPPVTARADLQRCLALASRNHPNLMIASAKLRKVRAQLKEAYFAPFMQFQAIGGVSLAPTVRGNNVFSPNTDVSLTSSLGVAWRAGFSGVVPLWTFGKISNLWEAAEANVEVGDASVAMTRDAIRFDVRKAYYGLQLARDALELLKDAQSQVDTAVRKLEKKIEDDEGDPIDLLKLQTFGTELDARRSEALRYERIARAGLRFYTASPGLDIPDDPLAPASHKLEPLERYLAAARLYRPEMRMVRAGKAAREAQLRLSRARLFPDMGLALQAGLTAAPEVSDQINPFTRDQANYFHYGAALVFQWKLDFVPALARVEQAEAQLEEMIALDRKALGGIAAEVEEAYAEAADWRSRLDTYNKAVGYAKRWLSTVQQAIDIGTMEDKELVEPAKAYAQNRYNVLKATMEFDLALAKLARVTAWDSIAPAGR